MLGTTKTTLLSISIALACASLVPLAALAAESIPVTLATTSLPSVIASSGGTSVPAGLSSCFDYYTFGSVPASVSPSLTNVAQGSTIAFSGTVDNKNTYLVSDVTVYVKIFRDRTGGTKNVDGPDVVDWFPAAEHLTLKAGESHPLSFTWHVPYDADPGAYKAALYTVSSDRFELAGLSFTDDVIGSGVPFTVVGTGSGDVHFNKSSVTFTDGVRGTQQFHFAAFPPTIASSSKSVVVSASLANTTAQRYDGSVSWSLYYWDALQQSHLVSQSSQAVRVGAHASTTVSYTATDTAHAVYYLVGELKTASGGKSIINVRFVRDGVPEPRINFMGVNSYPATASTTAFVCVHSTSATLAENTRVELTATPTGVIRRLLGPLAHASYTGMIPGDLSALTAPLAGGYNSFDLTASLYQNDKLVDTVTIPYRCEDLGTACDNTDVYTTVAVLIVLVGGALMFWRRRAVPPSVQSFPPNQPSL